MTRLKPGSQYIAAIRRDQKLNELRRVATHYFISAL